MKKVVALGLVAAVALLAGAGAAQAKFSFIDNLGDDTAVMGGTFVKKSLEVSVENKADVTYEGVTITNTGRNVILVAEDATDVDMTSGNASSDTATGLDTNSTEISYSGMDTAGEGDVVISGNEGDDSLYETMADAEVEEEVEIENNLDEVISDYDETNTGESMLGVGEDLENGSVTSGNGTTKNVFEKYGNWTKITRN